MFYLILTPIVVYVFIKGITNRKKIPIFFALMILAIQLLHTFYPEHTAIAYTIAVVPLAFIIIFMSKIKHNKWFINLAIFMLIASILITSWLSFGFVKDQTDKIIPVRPLLAQQYYHAALANEYVNANIPPNSIVLTRQIDFFDNSSSYYYPQYLRDDLIVHPLHTQVKEEVHRHPQRISFTTLYTNDSSINTNNITVYVISSFDKDFTTRELYNITKNKRIRTAQLYATDNKPTYHVYKVDIDNTHT